MAFLSASADAAIDAIACHIKQSDIRTRFHKTTTVPTRPNRSKKIPAKPSHTPTTCDLQFPKNRHSNLIPGQETRLSTTKFGTRINEKKLSTYLHKDQIFITGVVKPYKTFVSSRHLALWTIAETPANSSPNFTNTLLPWF